MRFLFYLILLSCIFVEYSLTINDNDYIFCTSHCSQIIVSFSQPLIFPTECQENDNFTFIHDYALACGIEYRINYDTQQIHIDFKASNDTGSLEDKKSAEFLVQTIWLSLNQYVNQDNVTTRKYGCNTNNDCARKFYINTIEYLINDGKLQLDLIRTKLYNQSLLMGEKSQRSCIDGSKSGNKPRIRCRFGLCYARYANYEFNEKQIVKTQTCDLEIKPTLFSEIEHHSPVSSQNEREILEYRGNKNVCNRDDIIETIRTCINQYTQWKTTPKEINVINPEKEMNTEKEINEINPKKENSSIKQILSSYILVTYLIFLQLLY